MKGSWFYSSISALRKLDEEPYSHPLAKRPELLAQARFFLPDPQIPSRPKPLSPVSDTLICPLNRVPLDAPHPPVTAELSIGPGPPASATLPPSTVAPSIAPVGAESAASSAISVPATEIIEVPLLLHSYMYACTECLTGMHTTSDIPGHCMPYITFFERTISCVSFSKPLLLEDRHLVGR